MSVIRQISCGPWPTAQGQVYEKLLDTVGTDRFGPEVLDAVSGMTSAVRRLYLFEASSPEDSALQYYSCEPDLVELFPTYRKYYLAKDPLHDAYCAAPACGDLALQRIRPADITMSGFRRRFFEDAGIIERLTIIQRGRDTWRGINLVRHESEGPFSDDEIESLINLACLVLPMLPLNRKLNPDTQTLTVEQLERRFASRFNTLTLRERQVCARAVMGLSVEATALDLGIAKTSVLTYRQRAYQRLQVASPFELCALVTH